MKVESLHCFVLSAIDYGEADRIVSLFSLEHGRIKGFARAARKSRKRFGAALEAFARIDAQIHIKDGLCGLQQAEIHNIYPAIRAELGRIAHALYVCELVDALTPEGVPLPRLFRLMAAYLDFLEKTEAVESDRRFFEINLLNILGYRPSLDECTRCGAAFGCEGSLLQPDGELVCRSCLMKGQHISEQALKTLAACMATGTFGVVDFSHEQLQQAGMLLDRSIASHAGRSMKSLAFLEQVTG
jgi:DNA repair protein RecO (recombination protein O)